MNKFYKQNHLVRKQWAYVSLMFWPFCLLINLMNEAKAQLPLQNLSCTTTNITASTGYATGALASAGVGYSVTAYNFLPNQTFLQKAVVHTDANGALGIINIVTVQFTTFPENNSSADSNTVATRKGSLYLREGATMHCTGPEIQALRKGNYSSTFNPEYEGLTPNTDYILVIQTTVTSNAIALINSSVIYYGGFVTTPVMAFGNGTATTLTGAFKEAIPSTGTLIAPITVTVFSSTTFTVTGPTSVTVGTPVTVNVNLTNTGTGPTTSPLTVTTPIPAGTSFTGSTGTGRTCSQVGSNVVCTNPNTLAANGGTSSLGLTFTPNQTGTINITPTVNGGGLTNPITAKPYPITVNPSSVNPILGVTLTAPATGTQNVPYNYSVTIANTGTGPTVGTTTFTLALPSGVSYVSATGTGWTCAAQSSSVVCTNPNPIANGSSSSLSISVNPTQMGTIYDQAYVSGGGMTVKIKGSAPCIGCSISPTGPIIINQALNFNLAVKAILQGPYVASAGMMHDSLRVKNLIPLSNPYSLLAGFTQVGNGTETTTSTVLSVAGTNAIVDWVLIELRSASNPSLVVATKAGLIQRDGDVVSPVDGTSALQFTGIPAGNYYVSIRHRNHLGAMSANPVSFGSTTAMVDLTNSAQPAYKLRGMTSTNYPQYVSGSKAMLWAGNATYNNQIIFQGPNDDVDMIFFTIISNPLNTQVISNFINRGYNQSDVNMDGKTVFQGPDNEVDIIFFNVLMHPENPAYLTNFIIWK